MNISKRDQKLLLVLLGIAVFLITYLVVFKSFNAKSDALQAQIDTLTPRLEELRGYEASLSTYQSEIKALGESISLERATYPADIRSEDLILFANDQAVTLGLDLTNVNVTPAELVSQFSVPEKNGDAYTLVPVAALRTGLEIQCGLDYSQLKKLLNAIYAQKQRTIVNSVDVSYNSTTGALTATVSIEKFLIAGKDYIYEKTNIPGIEQGTDDPFGTVTLVTETAGEAEQN